MLRSLRSRKNLALGKQRETHILSQEEKEKWIEDYVERETAVARTRVEDAETAIKQKQDDMRNAEKAGLTTTKPEMTFEEMSNTIRDSLSDLASSDNGENWEDEDDDEEDPAGGKLSEDDKPRWVMGTIRTTVQYRMARRRQKQMKLDEMTQPGWRDTADYICERDKKYCHGARKIRKVWKELCYGKAETVTAQGRNCVTERRRRWKTRKERRDGGGII